MPGYIKNRGKRRDGSTKWQARWRPPGDPSDKGRIEKLFRNKRDAERWISTMDTDSLRGTYIDPRSGEQPFTRVVEEYRETWGRLAPKTRVGYTSILNRHVLPEFGSKKVAAIQAHHVQAFHNKLAATHAPNTVRRIMDVLRGVLALAVKRRYIASNPASTDNVELAPKQRRQHDIAPLTHEQVEQLVQALPEHWRLPVLLDAYTGLRAGELWALRRESYDSQRGELAVTHALKEVTTQAATDTPDTQRLTDSLIIGPTKTFASRKVSVPEFLRAAIAEHVLRTPPNPADPNPLLFTTPSGTPVRHNLWYKRTFTAAAKSTRPANPPRFHDLRHTCAAWLIDAGAHPLQIKLRLGHESIRTTMDTYGHLFPSAEPELAALLDQARSAAAPASPAPRGTPGVPAQISPARLNQKLHD